jgi:HAMP domain-containing protein
MLSLRARLLVLLIRVTAAFLLIMGAVSTIVLGRRLGGEFNSQLIAAAQHSPQQIASNPGDYVAVEITYLPVQVRPLTGNSAGTRELATTVENLISRHVARYYIGGQPFAVPPTTGPPTTGPRTTGPRLRAVARLIPARANGGVRAMLVVARPVSAVTGQVGGIVITELITGGALILLLAVSGRWLIGRGLAPLNQMARTAHQITSRGDLTARMPDGDDSTEVGQLGGPSTRCWTGSSRRSAPAGARSRRSASSPPTPRTSCACRPSRPPTAARRCWSRRLATGPGSGSGFLPSHPPLIPPEFL